MNKRLVEEPIERQNEIASDTSVSISLSEYQTMLFLLSEIENPKVCYCDDLLPMAQMALADCRLKAARVRNLLTRDAEV